jgi:hypothetical protein
MAAHAVDLLADRHFPAQRATIVSGGLHSEERITGGLAYCLAAVRFAVSGGAVGAAAVGWLSGLLNVIDPVTSGLILATYGVLFGALLGAGCGEVAHVLSARQRSLVTEQSVRAESFSFWSTLMLPMRLPAWSGHRERERREIRRQTTRSR